MFWNSNYPYFSINPALLCSLAGGDARHSPLPWHLLDWSHHAWHSPSGLCRGNLGQFFGTLSILPAFLSWLVSASSPSAALKREKRKGKQYAVLLTRTCVKFCAFISRYKSGFSLIPSLSFQQGGLINFEKRRRVSWMFCDFWFIDTLWARASVFSLWTRPGGRRPLLSRTHSSKYLPSPAGNPL